MGEDFGYGKGTVVPLCPTLCYGIVALEIQIHQQTTRTVMYHYYNIIFTYFTFTYLIVQSTQQ